ncbi:hypothetical protein PAXINDRAFT_164689 [Paxillus involutus ATCC 200175]|uniref:Major facilitator superfamily (MFS) profile domain-containing protein n=1 Tax=Paxillus involutus ATCC 200175 TaxID=664439 RepID=A0A0C9SMK3_PAXIN|nr:hypothetical protein PAXINDRAFT_164689 [Paxillus involutus ATCC 200175]
MAITYLLAACTFTLLYGCLYNVLGRRGANQTAVIAAALGTTACGFSRNMEPSIITSDMDSLRSRGLTQLVSSIFSGLGLGLGGPVGGLVSDR